MNLNKLLFAGRLTRDVQVKNLNGGMTVAEFGVAMSEKRTNKSTGEEKEIPCFLDCAAFGNTGEAIAQHFQKGKAIFLEGKLKFDTWEKDGQKRSKLSMIVDSFQFVGPKEGGGQSIDRSTSQERRPAPQRQQAAPPQDEQQFTDADIPF